MAVEAAAVPNGMRKLYQRLERWRGSHPGRPRLPECLWASATELAREQGVGRTAQVLRLDYCKLKRRVQSAGPVAPPTTAPAGFLELMAAPPAGAAECLIELEGPRGKMRIQWKGTTAPDLAALSRTLWEPA